MSRMEECHTKKDHFSDKHQKRISYSLNSGALLLLSTFLVNPVETEVILVEGKKSNWTSLVAQ